MRSIQGFIWMILSCHAISMLDAEDVCDLSEARIGVITQISAEIIRDYAKRLVRLDYLFFREQS